MQCENAPCEVVCPVNATVHERRGAQLAMVYNRCVGTRYCSNNCPYKVRRFNWFNYNERPLDQLRLGPLDEKGMADSLKLLNNPEVTVRIAGRDGEMHVLRAEDRRPAGSRREIAAGPPDNIRATDEDRHPGLPVQTCPTRAIVFGDLNDKASAVVSRIKAQDPRDYGLLADLNTKPPHHVPGEDHQPIDDDDHQPGEG